MRFPRRRSGFALVVVLGILALLVALAVGFIIRATTERATAAGYKESSGARLLADNAVSLVQSQISTATTQGTDVSWTSQPGMVRTFGPTGSLLQAYKLYSAAEMISNSPLNLSADLPPSTWGTDVALWTDLNAPVQTASGNEYPILDPNATADGYKVTSAPGATTNQPVPMPVRWLYVLQDGSIVAPTTGTGTTATIPSETAANPIMGRIAFWTDDETCKLNINTASEGTYWDVPRARTNQEMAFALEPPWQKEFQRYPGHPAMTSLSTVFPNLGAEQIYGIIPRIVGGGSTEGTVAPTSSSSALTPDTDRLYASVQELVFRPDRQNNTGLTQTQLKQAKFFLTAQSRGPETNLFNLPRIACWPVFNGLLTNKTTAFDRLIAFCASTGGTTSQLPYYFQREIAADPFHDINLPRNTQLYSYLQYLTGKNVPGFGGNFLAKYGDDRDQILTEIFDYVRSTNLADDGLTAGNQFTPVNGTVGHGFVAPTQYGSTMGFGRSYTLSEVGLGFICNADGNVAASNNPATNRVLGSTALAATEKYVQAILVPEFFCPMAGYTAIRPNMRIEISGLDQLQVSKDAVTANLFPADANGAATYTDDPANYYAGNNYGGNPSWRYFGDAKVSPARGSLPGDTPVGGTYPTTFYPFIGTPIKLTGSGTMTFSGGIITVKIYTGTFLLQTLNINFPAGTFPIPNIVSSTITGQSPYPDATQEDWWAFSVAGAVAGKSGRLDFIKGNPGSFYSSPKSGCFFINALSTDVVRTVLPAHGDYRLVAATNNVPAATYPQPANPGSAFYKHRYYDTTTKMMASNLSNAQNTQIDQGYDQGGKYISTVIYPALFSPDIPSNATQTPESTGDFDDCLPPAVDGPFINKPDEGSNPTTGSPYFNTGYSVPGPTFFSPNRIMPSPGMFGSLPTGVKANVPWRTLLFRHQPTHFGATSPTDHLLLDLFWMPVVEPYAISDRFSTAGKINLNYQIMPFTYVERSTGLRALLKSEMMAAIPNNIFVPTVNTYKYPGVTSNAVFRFGIDSDETLSQFTTKFGQGAAVFRSASEICDVDIVPKGQTAASMSSFWSNDLNTGHALTAENLRERIYTTLYPRLTTKSNTFTVHFRAQALKKRLGSPVGTWTEGKDVVTGEYRGSAIIERFIDASNPNIPDYASHAVGSAISGDATLDTFYKWRVIANRQFAP